MNLEVYVPYPFKAEQDTVIPEKHYRLGKKLYTKTLVFCENNLTNDYEVDNSVYAKGIRVQLQDKEDFETVKQWIKQQN
jgi:hypothetical protein